MRRRHFLAAVAGAVAYVQLPVGRAADVAASSADLGAAARTPRFFGPIVARQVDHLAPDLGTGGPSAVIEAGQLFDRVGIHFRAGAPGADPIDAAESIAIELRTSRDGLFWTAWRTLATDPYMTDEANGTFYIAPQAVPAGSRYAQYRVVPSVDDHAGDPGTTASATGDAPTGIAPDAAARMNDVDLDFVSLTFIDATDLNRGPLARIAGGALAAAGGVASALTANSASFAAPTGAPRIRTRQDWGADESLMTWTPKYVPVQKIVVHHTATDDGGTNVAATIRSIYYFHAITRGWGDIGYSYLVDKYGNIWTGRQGGDNAVAGHAYGWNDGTIGVASIGDYSVNPPTGQLQGAIANVIALKLRQLGIPPYGSGIFTHQEQNKDGSWIKVSSTVANVLGHRDCIYIVGDGAGETSCPGGSLYAMLPGLRSQAQSAWQGGYTYLARIEPQLANGGYPGQVIPVNASVTNDGSLPIPAGTMLNYQLLKSGAVVGIGQAAPINGDVAPGATVAVPVAFVVPPLGNYIVRWDLQTGGTWWNTLYNHPVRDAWFRSADWSANWIDDNVTRRWTAGEVRLITTTVQNDGGRTWNASGTDPVQLGYYWINSTTGQRTTGTNFTPLGQDVIPGQVVTLQILVTAPQYPTNYTMVLDLNKQNEFWFKDKGLSPDDTPTTVGLAFKAAYNVGPLPAFTAGKPATVPVTIMNTGGGVFPFSGPNPVDLGYHWYDAATGATLLWDGGRTKLPADLGPGQAVTVQANVVAPSKGGTLSLRFDLVQEGVGWFSQQGVQPGTVTVTVVAPVYGASYRPGATILANEGSFSAVTFNVVNTSNFTWSPNDPDPIDLGYHWLDQAGNMLTWDGMRTKLPFDVAPGQSVTLNAQVSFPTKPGGYILRWDMVQEGITWFSTQGVKPLDVVITVGPPFYGGSMDVSQVPASMPAGQTVTVPLKVQNMSNFAWGSDVNLAYHWYDASGNAVVWDGLRTPLAGMNPNDLRTLAATVAVPTIAGVFTLRFDIVQEGVTWFSSQGMLLAPIAVSVK